MHSDLDGAIEEYLDAEEPGWAGMDLRSIEGMVSLFTADPLCAKEWTESHTLPMIEASRTQQVDFKEIAAMMGTPNVIRSFIIFDILSAKEARLGPSVYLSIFDFYNEALRAACLEDRFSKNLKNVVHGPEQVATLLIRCQPADFKIARTLGKLSNACYSLSHALYTDMYPALTYENFGPYCQPEGNLFALKTFHNLRPVELWPETQTIGADEIDIGALFEGVTLKVDATTHAIYEGNQVEGLRGWWCTADGKSHPRS